MRHLRVAACLFPFLLVSVTAQSSPSSPEFEVASVRRVIAKGPDPTEVLPRHVRDILSFSGGPGTKTPTRITYTGATLKSLLARAYNLKPEQVSGPKWLDTERYTIRAILPLGTDNEQLRLMLQSLLTERFEMKLHHVVKGSPVYRLTVSSKGARLLPAEDESSREYQAKSAADLATWGEQNTKKMNEWIAARKRGEKPSSGGNRHFHLPSVTLAKFAETLSGYVDWPVQDMTGIEGIYSFDLHWELPPEPSTGASSITAEISPSSGPDLFRALQEQLGLKLEAGKQMSDGLVVDKARRDPTDN